SCHLCDNFCRLKVLFRIRSIRTKARERERERVSLLVCFIIIFLLLTLLIVSSLKNQSRNFTETCLCHIFSAVQHVPAAFAPFQFSSSVLYTLAAAVLLKKLCLAPK